jgi:hypothetical protein
MEATLCSLVSFLWLLSGIVLYFISSRLYPEGREELIGPFQIAMLLLGPICWTYLGVSSIFIHKQEKKENNYTMDYFTSWKIFVLSLIPWVILITVIFKS